MTNICYSGGALGADTLFGECAKKAGHKVIHFHFEQRKADLPNHFILDDYALKEADYAIQRANETLKRGTFPYSKPYVNNLIRRNFYQVVDSTSLYAAARISNGQVVGGTGWAVQMYLDAGKQYAFVFDMHTNEWYHRNGTEWKLIPKHRISMYAPVGKYAGIGSRELTPEGIAAIKALYGQ
jgi:hypothetical protein